MLLFGDRKIHDDLMSMIGRDKYFKRSQPPTAPNPSTLTRTALGSGNSVVRRGGMCYNKRMVFEVGNLVLNEKKVIDEAWCVEACASA